MSKNQKHYLLLLVCLSAGLFALMLASSLLDDQIEAIVAVRGKSELSASARAQIDEWERQTRLVTATCYTATGNQTYSGTWPEWGTIAIRFASKTVGDLKMGDKVYLEEFEQVFVVEDRMPDKWTNRDIDIFFTSSEDCEAFGKQNIKLEIL